MRDLSLRIMRGDRIGLIGPNGAGKTTLLRLLLGELAPNAGSVRLGTKLEVAYFDQLRAVLELEKTVLENIAEGREYVDVQGQRRHVIGYLQDFLFSPDRARAPVKALSGGERNRLLLARLFAQPANLLVLDEPTNDLDIETLELLEELLDRLPRHAPARLARPRVPRQRRDLDAGLRGRRPRAGVRGRLRGLAAPAREAGGRRAKAARRTRGARASAKRSPAKLGFKDTRELEELPARIESLEAEQAELGERVSQPAFYKRDPAEQARVLARLAALAVELEARVRALGRARVAAMNRAASPLSRDPLHALPFTAAALLAPMEGVTEPCFRDLVLARNPASALGGAFTEFVRVSVAPIPRAVLRRELGPTRFAQPVGVQLMGSDLEHLARTARNAVEAGAPLVDLNFGCPAKGAIARLRGLGPAARSLRARARRARGGRAPYTFR